MAMEEESHQGAKYTKDPSCTIRCRVMACSNGPMADSTMAASLKGKNKAKVRTSGQMVKYMKGSSS